MNLKGITAPLTEKIGDLTALVQEMIDNLKEQTETQKKILAKLDEKNVCKTPEIFPEAEKGTH